MMQRPKDLGNSIPRTGHGICYRSLPEKQVMSPEIHEKVQPTKLADPNLVCRRCMLSCDGWVPGWQVR